MDWKAFVDDLDHELRALPPDRHVSYAGTAVCVRPGAPVSADDLAAVEQALDCVLPADYKLFMREVGPFGLGASRLDFAKTSAMRLFTPEEVIENTTIVRDNYIGAFGAPELDDLLARSVFFQFVDYTRVENFYGLDRDGRVRRLDHDDVSRYLSVAADSFTSHLQQWRTKLFST